MKTQDLGSIICLAASGNKRKIQVLAPRSVHGQYYVLLSVNGPQMRTGARMHITADDAVQLSEILKTASEIAGKADNQEAKRKMEAKKKAEQEAEERRKQDDLNEQIKYHERELERLSGLSHKQRNVGGCQRDDCHECGESSAFGPRYEPPGTRY